MAATELIYQSSKTYQHSAGFSCCFRQWRAESHCHHLHGYALKVELVFEAPLDDRNWVVDFGSLKPVKNFLERTFDHTTLVAKDDPLRQLYTQMAHNGLITLVEMDAVGCEKFAEEIFRWCEEIGGYPILSVQVWEHEANSAKVIRKPESSVHIGWDAEKEYLETLSQQHERENNIG